MKRFFSLVGASLRMVYRNRQAVFWTLAFPLVFMFLLGVIFGDDGGGSATVGVVDQDASETSGFFVSALGMAGNLTLQEGSEQDLLDELQDGDLAAVVLIPQGFGQQVQEAAAAAGGGPGGGGPGGGAGEGPLDPVEVVIRYDPSNVFASQVATGTLVAVIGEFQKQLAQRPDFIVPQLESTERATLTYTDFLIPGVLALALLTSGVIGIATSVVFFREQGILRRVQVTPLPLTQFMGARVFVQLVLSMVQAVVLLGFGRLVFGVNIGGELLAIVLLLIVGTLAFVFIGFFVSSFTKTVEATGAVANIVTTPMMFLGGIFFPVDNAPSWIKPVVQVMPVKYLADGLRAVMVRGQGLPAVWDDIAILAGVALFFGLLSTRVFRWRE